MPKARDAKSDYYAWSEIHNGGKSELVNRPNGLSVKVITERNIVAPGEKVSEGDFDDADWEQFVASGSVRPYAYPEDANEYTSPHAAVMAQLVDPATGEVDINKVMELQNLEALATLPEATNPPAAEGKEVPEGV